MSGQQRQAEEKQSRGAPGVESALAEALGHHEAGRLVEAERLYRQILAVDPNQADALHLLGMVAYQVGRRDVAVDLIGRAVASRPSEALFHCNLGLVLSAQGKLDAAVASYRRALALQPDNVEACVNLGNALKDQDRLDEAEACYRRALAIRPDLPEAHGNLGNVLRAQGKLDEAVACYRQALALRPGYVEAHSNLGNALRDQNKLDEAIVCYRQALALRPDLAEAHNNLGNALKDQDRLDEAEACYRKAIDLKPAYADALNNLALLLTAKGEAAEALNAIKRSLQIKDTAATKTIFVDCVRKLPWTHDDGELKAALVRALTEPWCRPGKLARTGAAILKCDAHVGPCIARAAAAWPRLLSAQELFGAGAPAALASDLLVALLCATPVADIELERFLTIARRHLLDVAATTGPGADADTPLIFYSALARQCFINEYVFHHGGDEFQKAGDLRDRLTAALETGAPVPALWLLAMAAYFPLFSLPAAARLLDRQWPEPVVAVLAQQVHEPEQERQLSAAIPRLTGIEDEVSRRVQSQYEENPYPRWVKAEPVETARSLTDYLRQHVALPSLASANGETIDVLIAGCGTGQQSIGMARLLKGARVLAVDLSLSSLSYAKRKTQELGLTSIEYAQADLLALGSLDRQFDVVASVGVLHHLADPFAGWRVLLSLLRPGGFMNIGFYSEVARRDITKAKAFIAAQGYASTADDIRRCRQALMDRRADFSTAVGTADFYNMSTCRDLLFHTQEHLLLLPVIEAFLRDNGLTFLGFEIGRDVVQAYKRRFPDDPAATDLARWQAFENENPHTFGAMYQFWVQKAVET